MCYAFEDGEKSAIHVVTLKTIHVLTDEMQRKAKTAVNITTDMKGTDCFFYCTG